VLLAFLLLLSSLVMLVLLLFLASLLLLASLLILVVVSLRNPDSESKYVWVCNLPVLLTDNLSNPYLMFSTQLTLPLSELKMRTSRPFASLVSST
jgi:hypothetical protein